MIGGSQDSNLVILGYKPPAVLLRQTMLIFLPYLLWTTGLAQILPTGQYLSQTGLAQKNTEDTTQGKSSLGSSKHFLEKMPGSHTMKLKEFWNELPGNSSGSHWWLVCPCIGPVTSPSMLVHLERWRSRSGSSLRTVIHVLLPAFPLMKRLRPFPSHS